MGCREGVEKIQIDWEVGLSLEEKDSGLEFRNLFIYLFIFRAAPTAYGSSQVRCWNRAAAASPCYSHRNTESQPHLLPHQSSQQRWIPDSLNEARDRTCILMDTSQIRFCWATTGTPNVIIDMFCFKSIMLLMKCFIYSLVSLFFPLHLH